jgi:hypothetical protein
MGIKRLISDATSSGWEQSRRNPVAFMLRKVVHKHAMVYIHHIPQNAVGHGIVRSGTRPVPL